jgi:hypothetical protein
MSFRNALSQFGHWLDMLTATPAERRYWKECESRPVLTDDEFYDRFYKDSGIQFEIVRRVRQILAHQLGLERAIPSDAFGPIFPDLDFWEVMLEIAEQFGFSPVLEDCQRLDGTFDSFVKWAAKGVAQ